MKKISVLIVEDEAIVAFDLATQLKSRGFSVAGITGYGEDVLSIVSNDHVDLILLDIRLKGSLTGIDVARSIEEFSSARIIFLTALGDGETATYIKQHPHFSLIRKPFNSEDLFIEIEHTLKILSTN